MYTLIIVLMVLASILLCGIVLIQESKGGGLASGFSAGNQFAGVRKTTDFIEKATWGLALSLVIFSVLSVAFIPRESKSDTLIENTMPINTSTSAGNTQGFSAGQPKPAANDNAQKAPAAPAENAPAAPVAPAEN
ncbi:MAG: preprotein translocase subunit SecG [Bacteroidaceae bacterium]|nr:preprotein translocase subunit SecG [Bacteroidaceae bacterium]